MGHLTGFHVALTASRKTDEMQALLHKQGATSEVHSMQGTVAADPATIAEQIKQGLERQVDFFVFTTGVGVNALLESAEQIGVYKEFILQLKTSSIIVRGYKALAALRKVGIECDITSDDGTIAGLVPQLEGIEFNGKCVVVQQYGAPSPSLDLFFEQNKANVIHWLPYVHYPPKAEPIERFITELLDERFLAVCFTTALQVKSLFNHARIIDEKNNLVTQFSKGTIAVAVGKVTAESLLEEGVQRIITPEKERMGAMVIELAHYVKSKKET